MAATDAPRTLYRRISLAQIDAVVSARLGPTRVEGNAQPAVFNRQVAMYLANRVGGWSTTRIGKFYNGRDHSTVCHGIQRIQSLRDSDPEVDGLVTSLSAEIRTCAEDRPEFPLAVAPDTAGSSAPTITEELLDLVIEKLIRRLRGATSQ
jgi:hypothetical protein